MKKKNGKLVAKLSELQSKSSSAALSVLEHEGEESKSSEDIKHKNDNPSQLSMLSQSPQSPRSPRSPAATIKSKSGIRHPPSKSNPVPKPATQTVLTAAPITMGMGKRHDSASTLEILRNMDRRLLIPSNMWKTPHKS